VPLDYVGGPVWLADAIPAKWVDLGLIDEDEEPIELSNPVSGSRDAWRIEKSKPGEGSSATATYLASLNKPDDSDLENSTEVTIKVFYKIASFVYEGGIEKVAFISPDGFWKAANNDDGGTLDITYWDAEDDDAAGMAARVAWLDALYAANDDLKFRVYYYVLEGQTPKYGPDRPLTMAEYYRAVYTVDADGNARASLPQMFGNTVTGGRVPGTPRTYSTPLQYVLDDGDWELYLGLFYYNILLTDGAGKGKVDMNTAIGIEEFTYKYPNSAIIPIGSRVLTYTGVEKVKKTNGSYDETPDVPSTRSTTDETSRRRNLKTTLGEHWNLFRVYGEGDDAIKVKIPFATAGDVIGWKNIDDTSGAAQFAWEYNFEDLDEGVIAKVKRVGEEGVIVTVPPPPSSDEEFDVTFDYYQMP